MRLFSILKCYCLLSLLGVQACVALESSSLISNKLGIGKLGAGNKQGVFQNQQFTDSDSVLVTDAQGNSVYSWRADALMIPASVAKLVTANLAIEKWGLDHHFISEFYLLNDQLWIKGMGDPYLVSEEIELIAIALQKVLDGTGLANSVKSVHIDNGLFARDVLPGQSKVSDPYNAPVSALAANFNTVKLLRKSGVLKSSEPQTPLTSTAKVIGAKSVISANGTRVNLINTDYAQKHFAELLIAKLAWPNLPISINKSLPDSARLIYTHHNSKRLQEVLTGALEYSNNFIANQVFLLLGQRSGTVSSEGALNFIDSAEVANQMLKNQFNWQASTVVDGAGLSRNNRISANQIDQILDKLRGVKTLLKRYVEPQGSATAYTAHAKTGTLSGVHSFAGYLRVGQSDYQFVFIFNRDKPYRYREKLLSILAQQLAH